MTVLSDEDLKDSRDWADENFPENDRSLAEQIALLETDYRDFLVTIDHLQSQLQAKDTEIAELKSINDGRVYALKKLQSQLNEGVKVVRELNSIMDFSQEIEALEWYADEENHWRSHQDDMCMSEVDDDGGGKALEALSNPNAAYTHYKAMQKVVGVTREWRETLSLLIDMSENVEGDGTNAKYSSDAVLDAENKLNDLEHDICEAVDALERLDGIKEASE